MNKKHLLASLFLFIFLGFMSMFFYRTAELNQKVAGVSTSNEPGVIGGVILPHHDLAREYIIESLEGISKTESYTRIVVIGPNHYYPEQNAFITSTSVNGYKIADEDVRKLISKQNNLIEDEKVVQREHSFTIPAKYLQNFFPDAQFVPVIVPQNFDGEKLGEFAVKLSENLPENTLFVASVDFSHEKMVLEGEYKNKESISAISEFDYSRIYTFKSDHMDSPPSIGLLLSVMENRGTKNWELMYESHGAFIEGDPTIQGTGYVIGKFSK